MVVTALRYRDSHSTALARLVRSLVATLTRTPFGKRVTFEQHIADDAQVPLDRTDLDQLDIDPTVLNRCTFITRPRGLCVPKTLSRVLERQNRVSWRNDRAGLLCTGRSGFAIQVEEPA
jgi:hypothetical protein